MLQRLLHSSLSKLLGLSTLFGISKDTVLLAASVAVF